MKTKPIPMASIYGCIRGQEPTGGIWQVHKHVPTGELLGPCVVLGFPTTVVYARQTQDGWVEVI